MANIVARFRRPPRTRFFYGWVILATTFIACFLGDAMQDTVFSTFYKPVSQDLGWSRTTFALGQTAGIIAVALVSPLLGWLLDRRGPRAIMSVGGLVAGSIFVLLSRMTSVWEYWVFYTIGRATTQTTMLALPATTIANWFVRRRGRALGIQAMAIGVGGLLLTILAQDLIGRYSWRVAYLVFGAAMFVVVVPTCAVFLRRRPEDLGLLPDGEPTPSEGQSSATPGPGRQEYSFTLAEALRTPTLWILVLAGIPSAVGTSGINLHAIPHLTDVGLSAAVAASAVGTFSIVGAVAGLAWGIVAERVKVRYCLMAAYSISAVAVVVLMGVHTALGAFLFAILLGLSARGLNTLLNVAYADYFGRINLGTIRGFTQPIQTIGMAAGPLFAAWIFDTTGSYQTAFVIIAGGYLLGGAMLLLAVPPKPHGEKATQPP